MNTFQAKRIPLTTLLARLGHEPHHTAKGEPWYLSPFREETAPSFKVNVEKNVWYDFGAGHGGNIIDFARHYYRVSTVSEALQALDSLGGLFPAEAPTPAPRRTPTPAAAPALQVQKVQPLQNTALLGYLKERGIPAEIARLYLQEMYYTRDGKRYFALAFPNESGGFELRNPYFKGVYGAKDIALVKRKSAGWFEHVWVFEGFMDFLSMLAWLQAPEPAATVIVMNSVALREKALTALRNQNPARVELYLDHDDSGRQLTQYFQEQLEGLSVLDRSSLYTGYKDFNDYWRAERGMTRA